ncbi:MAG: hypothetical protein Kow0092_24130 [Deferrisomatales bacterium]
MATRRKVHPDYYQIPRTMFFDEKLYREEARKIRARTPALPAIRVGWSTVGLLRAGDRLRASSRVRCRECGAEAFFLVNQEVPPCRHCGANTFHQERG